MKSTTLTIAAVAIATALTLGVHQIAHAQAVDGEVLVVLAKEEPGEIDAALEDEPALQKPPFNAFRTMKVLDKPRIKLTEGTATEVELPNERRVRITLEHKLPDGRFQVKTSINRPGKKDYLPLLTVVTSPGDPFFVAGQSYKGGKLVIGVRIGAKSQEN